MNKIYVILYNAYEFDDLGYGDLTPKFLSLDENKVKEEFHNLKEKEIKWFNKFVYEHPQVCKDNEDYQIVVNKDDELEIYMGNWCYHWVLSSYELDKIM
jgi:hypothetical protein